MWGEPDDDVEFPNWMLPDNHPQKMKSGFRQSVSYSLEQAAAEVLKKPPVTIVIKEPGDLT